MNIIAVVDDWDQEYLFGSNLFNIYTTTKMKLCLEVGGIHMWRLILKEWICQTSNNYLFNMFVLVVKIIVFELDQFYNHLVH